MISIRLKLHCEGSDCASVFPERGSVDGVIYNAVQLRKAARLEGWRRRGDFPRRYDLCPFCAKQFDHAHQNGGRG
jgi:hypothetical protein